MHIKLGKKISSLYYFITATKIARIATKHNNDKNNQQTTCSIQTLICMNVGQPIFNLDNNLPIFKKDEMQGTLFSQCLLQDHEIHKKYDNSVKIGTVSNLLKKLTLYSTCDGIMNGRIQQYCNPHLFPSKNEPLVPKNRSSEKKC